MKALGTNLLGACLDSPKWKTKGQEATIKQSNSPWHLKAYISLRLLQCSNKDKVAEDGGGVKGSIVFSRTASPSVGSQVHFCPRTGSLICTTMVWKESGVRILSGGS